MSSETSCCGEVNKGSGAEARAPRSDMARRGLRRLLRAGAAFAVTLLLPALGLAGTLSGKVTDSANNAIANVAIHLQQGGTTVASATSAANGTYSVSHLQRLCHGRYLHRHRLAPERQRLHQRDAAEPGDRWRHLARPSVGPGLGLLHRHGNGQGSLE